MRAAGERNCPHRRWTSSKPSKGTLRTQDRDPPATRRRQRTWTKPRGPVTIEVADPVTKRLVDDEADARFVFPSGGDDPRFNMPRFLLFDFSPYSRQTGGRDFRLNLRFTFQSIGAFPVSLQPLIVTPRVQCYPGPKIKPRGRRCHFEHVGTTPNRIDEPRVAFGVDAAPEFKM